MKRIMLILVTGILLLGVNAYAAGDLKVTGLMGVGTDPTPTIKLNVVGTDMQYGQAVGVTNASDHWATIFSMSASSTRNNTDNTPIGGDTVGIQFFNNIKTASDSITGRIKTFDSTIQFENDTRVHTVSSQGPVNFLSKIRATSGTWNFSVPVASFVSDGITSHNGTMNLDSNFYHYWAHDSTGGTFGTGEIQAGLWVDALTQAASGGGIDYGIVLDGDGAGSDIVFGPSQEARIYSSGGRLYAQDSANNTTIFSPHDPVTGEWIFYSRNTKTGKTVRVNMEKLVKAVEKLTGETFMVETLMENE